MNKLAVSNIAWTGNDDRVFELLASLGVHGIEVAPGKIANGWEELSLCKIKKYRDQCQKVGLSIPSFQAFLFGLPHLQLLGSEAMFNEMVEHVNFVAELAEAAGAKVLVYGAPKSRLLLGHKISEAKPLAIDRLGRLAEVCWQHGVSIGLEAVPETYGGEFITSFRDSLYIVNAVNSPGLVLHLDTGCTWMKGENIYDAIITFGDRLRHFHVSQPKLSNFDGPASYHRVAAASLARIGYANWVCIEMLEGDKSIHNIQKAIEYTQEIYLNNNWAPRSTAIFQKISTKKEG